MLWRDPEQVTTVGPWAQSHWVLWDTVGNRPQRGCAEGEVAGVCPTSSHLVFAETVPQGVSCQPHRFLQPRPLRGSLRQQEATLGTMVRNEGTAALAVCCPDCPRLSPVVFCLPPQVMSSGARSTPVLFFAASLGTSLCRAHSWPS